MRKPFLTGNWKMNYTSSEAVKVSQDLVYGLRAINSVVTMITPSFISLSKVADVLQGSNILLGAQNMSSKENGARTSEISAQMLIELGVDYVILGHSECRTYLNELDEIINKKIHLGLKYTFKYLILCIGETLEERESGKTLDIVLNQVRQGLKGVSENNIARIILAYEPVWAIGTGKTATKTEVEQVHKQIRIEIQNLYSKRAAQEIIIQYGGSVSRDNIIELMNEDNIDGALIGGASLKANSFIEIIKMVSNK